MGFSRQEYWSGLSCPPPGDLPDPGIETASLVSPALAGDFFTTSATWEALKIVLSERKERKKVKSLSRVQLFVTPWTVACEAPPSMEFSRQEYWSGLPFPVGFNLCLQGRLQPYILIGLSYVSLLFVQIVMSPLTTIYSRYE